MSESDPMLFAAQAAGMTDHQLYGAFHLLTPGDKPTAFQQAVLDEAEFRGMLTHSEIQAISGGTLSVD